MAGELQRKSGLARPASAGEGHQARRPQQPSQFDELPVPTHEAGQLDGKIVGASVEGPRGRKIGGETGDLQLEKVLRKGKIRR